MLFLRLPTADGHLPVRAFDFAIALPSSHRNRMSSSRGPGFSQRQGLKSVTGWGGRR
jgi:hypothetical protein